MSNSHQRGRPTKGHCRILRRLAIPTAAVVLFLGGCDSGTNNGDTGSGGNGSLEEECDPSYPDFCIPSPPPDLDCADVGGPFTVTGSDPHGFDGDGDGVGCEYG
jgi:hypothetical protein